MMVSVYKSFVALQVFCNLHMTGLNTLEWVLAQQLDLSKEK